MKEKTAYGFKITILSVCCLAVFFLSFFLGRYDLDFLTVVRILADRLVRLVSFGKLGLMQTWTSAQQAVVVNIRLPRILAAVLIGAALSVAGASYQGMFRNPMVSPDLLGASTGAGFGAALAILLGFSYTGITLSSFVFGLLAVLLAYLVSKASRIQTTLAMVLAGVMVSSLFSAGTGFVKLVADTESQLPAITYWLMGSLSSIKAKDLTFAVIPILLGLVPIILLRWRINLLTVSEAEARSMGIETGKLRLVVIICATLMTSAAISISGMIGWVGLAVPHFCRLIFGQDYRRLVPSSAIMGALFLLLTDNVARTVASSEIPLGILTAFIGAPVFMYLIITGGSSRDD